MALHWNIVYIFSSDDNLLVWYYRIDALSMLCWLSLLSYSTIKPLLVLIITSPTTLPLYHYHCIISIFIHNTLVRYLLVCFMILFSNVPHTIWHQKDFLFYGHVMRSRYAVTWCGHIMRSRCAVTLCGHVMWSHYAVMLCGHVVRSRCVVTLCGHVMWSCYLICWLRKWNCDWKTKHAICFLAMYINKLQPPNKQILTTNQSKLVFVFPFLDPFNL